MLSIQSCFVVLRNCRKTGAEPLQLNIYRVFSSLFVAVSLSFLLVLFVFAAVDRRGDKKKCHSESLAVSRHSGHPHLSLTRDRGKHSGTQKSLKERTFNLCTAQDFNIWRHKIILSAGLVSGCGELPVRLLLYVEL